MPIAVDKDKSRGEAQRPKTFKVARALRQVTYETRIYQHYRRELADDGGVGNGFYSATSRIDTYMCVPSLLHPQSSRRGSSFFVHFCITDSLRSFLRSSKIR